MKIILASNKYLKRGIFNRIDVSYWNFYIPFLQLGHEVYFYDTTSGDQKPFMEIVEDFKPELIFTCFTYDKSVTPYEPIEEIKKITKNGNIKTFNWFCDDTWRFEKLSKNVCWDFTACSTPEPNCVEKYKNIGYNNIILGCWHTNNDLCQINDNKTYDVGFCGSLNNQRANMIYALRNKGINVNMFYGVSQEEMMTNYSLSKVGINFSVNENDPDKKTQMKLRMIEIPASKSLLLTEYTDGLEQLFEINKEIITFKEPEEMVEKLKFMLNNNKVCTKIAEAGYKRFMNEHESKIRLKNVLEKIKKI